MNAADPLGEPFVPVPVPPLGIVGPGAALTP